MPFSITPADIALLETLPTASESLTNSAIRSKTPEITNKVYSPSLSLSNVKKKGKRVGGVQESAISQGMRQVWEDFEKVLSDHFYEPDLDAATLLFASIAAHRLNGQPVWPMLIAPPGSMKTELLKSLSKQPKLYTVDSVTPKTFISGQFGNKAGETSSLLERIGPTGILIIPDFSTVLGKRQEERAGIYSDLRRIFDGELVKHFGTREGTVRWEGRITVAVAATPAVDEYASFEGTLGDRFVRVRMNRGGGTAALYAQRQDPKMVRKAMTESVTALFKAIPKLNPTVSDEMALRIASLADFVAIGRTHVGRDQSKDITSMSGFENAESATRLSQQFYQLARGLALVRGRKKVGEDEFRLIRRVAMDTLPVRRAAHVRRLIAGIHVTQHETPALYALEDLIHLGLVAEDKRGFTPHAIGLLKAAGIFA